MYRVLHTAGLLSKFIRIKKSKGIGYEQPEGPHKEWHIDISYVNVMGAFMFLVAIIDGYLRFIVHHELRAAMEEKDVEFVVQRALDRFPGQRPRIISDRGTQFIAKDFKKFIRYARLSHTFTSIGYVTPFDKLIGRDKEIIAAREHKFEKAWKLRVKYNTNSTLTYFPILSNSR